MQTNKALHLPPDIRRNLAYTLDIIRRDVVRWASVPLLAIAGWCLAAWASLGLWLQCLHFGRRPSGLCSDWWYSNHDWVAGVVFALLLFLGFVLLPSLVAPSRSRLVYVGALSLAVCYVSLEFDRHFALILATLLAASVICWGLLFRRRQVKRNEV